ncbi:hypothetical protein BU25DRAFT_407636 [Macroventuria anomochaeta]|uniref:Uncharacterized protein n=1 Tax=Macroventuria anomochaeta TaxID=301207 RepID=A0ACB6SC34_9PLEO|nr:uncharacterized protein BU25DRAFT_407636 [Macroventuria anomochaeta]KAF2631077.1 hypothetical protein BU25DRAFT_407636 [Macroventuria anomochaeta]
MAANQFAYPWSPFRVVLSFGASVLLENSYLDDRCMGRQLASFPMISTAETSSRFAQALHPSVRPRRCIDPAIPS